MAYLIERNRGKRAKERKPDSREYKSIAFASRHSDPAQQKSEGHTDTRDDNSVCWSPPHITPAFVNGCFYVGKFNLPQFWRALFFDDHKALPACVDPA